MIPTQDDVINVVKLNGLVIDEATGEILEAPDGWQGDLLEHVIRAGVHANAQRREWERTYNVYRHAAGKKLDERGLARFHSETAGRAGFTTQLRRSASAEGVNELVETGKLPKRLVQAVLATAVTLDPTKLEKMANYLEAAGKKRHAEAIRSLIDEKVVRFVTIDQPRESAPAFERSTRRSRES